MTRTPKTTPPPAAIAQALAARASATEDAAEETAAEAAALDDRIATDDAASQLLSELVETTHAVRAAAPRPRQSPDWDRLSRDIARGCDEIDANRNKSRWHRLWQPKWFAVATATAMAGAVLLVLLLRDPPTPETQTATPDHTAAPVATLDDIDDDEFDELIVDLQQQSPQGGSATDSSYELDGLDLWAPLEDVLDDLDDSHPDDALADLSDDDGDPDDLDELLDELGAG